MDLCPDCWSVHIGAPCGMSFGERIRTVQVDKQNFVTAEKKNYYDRAAVRDTFGEDAGERARDATGGLGYGKMVNGEHYHRKGGTWERTSPEDFDRAYLGTKYVDEPKWVKELDDG